jgi:hypothetical protein
LEKEEFIEKVEVEKENCLVSDCEDREEEEEKVEVVEELKEIVDNLENMATEEG